MRWAREHPGRYEQIARLPLPQQNEALRAAMAPDVERAAAHYGEVLAEARATVARVEELDRWIAEEQRHDAAIRARPPLRRAMPLEVKCPRCGAIGGERCITNGRYLPRGAEHRERLDIARRTYL